MMGRRTLAPLLAAAMAVSGCEFDLTPVQRPDQARFSVRLNVDGVGGPLDAIAFFQPGFAASGGVRALAGDSVRLNGVAVAPKEVRGAGERVYRFAPLDADIDVLSFRPPAVVDLEEAPPTFVAHRIAPIAADTLVARRGGQLEVRVSGVARLPPEGLSGFWKLDVHPGACAGPELLSLTGNTAPPPVLAFSVALVPQDLQGGHLQVQAQVRQHASSAGGYYEIVVISSFHVCIPFRVIE